MHTPPWHWKDWTMAILAALLVTFGGLWLRDQVGWGGARAARFDDGREEVSVFDVVLDRDNRAFVDVFFDRPLGKGRAGEILGLPPATLEPPLAGVWRWRDEQILRFEPSGGFPMASEYRLALIPERLLDQGQSFAGDTELTLTTDRFLLEEVVVEEEPVPTSEATVVLRGRLQFNYPVDPRQLASLVRLVDPLAAEDEPVEVELEDVYWTREVIPFRTGEVRKTRDERTLELVIAGELTPAEGNAPLGDDARHEILLGSRDRLVVRDVRSTPGLRDSSIRIGFSSAVAPRVAGKYLTVEPTVDFRISAQRNSLTLTGPFEPGSRYTLTIDQGLPAEDEAVLREPYETVVTLDNLEPALDFQSQGTFLSASGYQNVAVDSVNVDRLQLAIDRAYLNNLFSLFEFGGLMQSDTAYAGNYFRRAFGDRIVDETLEIEVERNTRQTTVLPVGRYVAEDSPGLYRVLISRPGQWQASQRWILLTDLGAVAKRSENEVLVWVSSVTELTPVTGARVTLVSDQNQVIATGRTDAEGVWRFSDREALDEHRPYLLTIERNDDFTFLAFNRMGIDTAGLEVGGAPPLADGYTAFLYGERDIYRPGEAVEGLAVVRDGRLRPAPAMPALLRHRDPRGNEVETRTARIDDRGLSPFALELPAYALTGSHTLELEVAERIIGRYRFQVEEFIPDRIKVEIASDRRAVGPGEELVFDVTSHYLFGPPAADLPVESRVRLVKSLFSAPGFETFTFHNTQRELSDREIQSFDGTLDGEGKQTFAVKIPAGLEVPSGLAAVVTARVSEQGGRGVAARTSFPVHPYPYYLGLRRLGEVYPEPGQEVELEFVALSPDREPVPSGDLRADLYYVRWQTVLRRTPSGTYRYESTRDPLLIDEQTITGGGPRGSFRFTPTDYGSHLVVLTDPATGASTTVEFYASGWGYSPWAVENPGRLELDLDQEEYQPGETATVQVRAPFSGKLLVTVERDRVLTHQIHELAENTATLRIPIRSDYRPNTYVTATLVRSVANLEPGAVGRAFGAVPLFVDRSSNRLAIELTAPTEVRSQTELDVQVTAKPGSVVTVAAVDEGILQLIAQQTADPFEFFYRKLALAVNSFDTFSLLLPEVPLEAAAEEGGGFGEAGLAQYVRTEGIRRVEPVAFWSGPVETDPDGHAEVSFELPEFQGALRLMAVALKNDEFGSSERLTRVRDPLVLLPTLPRILSFGERLEVPVTLRNDTGRRGPFAVSVELEGPADVVGEALATVEVDDGAESTHYFSIRTGETEGEIGFAFQATGAGEVARATGRVGVRADLPPQAFESSGSLTDATTEVAVAVPVDFRAGTVNRELRIGPLPLVQFAGKLADLNRYPYGCLEQTISQAFPQIYLADLAAQFDPELLDPDNRYGRPEDHVQEALRKVARLQLGDGGFALWPGYAVYHPWTSVYAAHFVVEAERAGYPVASHTRDSALDFLAGRVRAKSVYSSQELKRTVYALYVLARAGQADPATMDFLRDKHSERMRPESRALLAAAYAAIGNPRAVDELLARIGEVAEVERQTGANFDSTIRNRALLLLALLDAAPDSSLVPELVDRLARDATTSPYWTTQESGFAFLALGQFFRQQAERPPYKGAVYLGDRKVGMVSSEETAVFRDLEAGAPLRIEMEPGYEAGAAFYSLITRGVPVDEDFQPLSAGLEIERAYLDREGDLVDLDRIRQGDLLVVRTRVRSLSGPVENIVIQNRLPSGLEVENPRLETTESLPWVTDAAQGPAYLDLRDDRILLFADLPANSWQSYYALVRAVAPGTFRLPPAQAEAMYNPALLAVGPRGKIRVSTR
jgi:uncharacterized protein YfaS (alpha-2-macroglobulin family)